MSRVHYCSVGLRDGSFMLTWQLISRRQSAGIGTASTPCATVFFIELAIGTSAWMNFVCRSSNQCGAREMGEGVVFRVRGRVIRLRGTKSTTRSQQTTQTRRSANGGRTVGIHSAAREVDVV